MKKLQKQLQRLLKKHKKQLFRFGVPLVAGVLLFSLGMTVQTIRIYNEQPQNLVWAVDETIKMPSGLKKMLLKRDDCKNYRGADSPKGVGLWGVTQVEQESFAKIAYGCSWELTSYMVAIREGNNWRLLQPVEYFSDTAQGVPSCKMVTQYKVPPTLESFCVNDAGELARNPVAPM